MLLRHREGHPVPVQMRLAPLRNRQGPIIAVAKSFDEHKAGSERNRSRYHLIPQGCFDEITGVSNHEFTQFRLRESLASFAQYQSPFGILLIQVDQLKHFGATYGRPAVDAILHVLAQTLQDSLRPSDFVGHWQDGQFLAIVIGCGAVGVERARERIAGAVSTVSMLWWGDEMSVTNSVGCAPVQSGDTIDSLLQRAERSLSQACAPSSGPASTGPPTQHTRRES